MGFINMEDPPEGDFDDMPDLTDTNDELGTEGVFDGSSFDAVVSVEVGIHNMEDAYTVSHIPTHIINKNRPIEQIIG